jgi:hypothetical protein
MGRGLAIEREIGMSWLDDVHGEKLQREQAERTARAKQEEAAQASTAAAFASNPRVIMNRQIREYALSLDEMIRANLQDIARLTWGADRFEFVAHGKGERMHHGPTFLNDAGLVVDLEDGVGLPDSSPRLASWTVRGPLLSSRVVPSAHGLSDRRYTYPYYRVGVGFGDDGEPASFDCESGGRATPPITEDRLRELLKAYYVVGPSIGQWSRY